MSNDGTKALAASDNGGVWRFFFGEWSPVLTSFWSVSMSNDGTKALACSYDVYNGVWYFDGTTWSQVKNLDPTYIWQSVSMSSDGGKALACSFNGGVWYFDGAIWSQVASLSYIWQSVSISGNGANALAGYSAGVFGSIQQPSPPSSAICLLPDCDVLLSNFTLKNITEITLSDEVIGYLSKRPEKIKKVIKRTHFTNFLEDTNKPYLIERSAFGPNVPDKDIHLSGHHRIITQTEDNHFVGVQSFKLDNCKKALNNPDEVTYYHILLENQGAGLIVNNLPVEDCIEENV
jgi:hypothetical protein